MRHLAALAFWAVSLAGAGALLDAIAAGSGSEGVVWIVTRGPAGPALDRVLASGDARLVNAWAGGRLLQLHVDSMRDAVLPAGSAWAALRFSAGSIGWPACG